MDKRHRRVTVRYFLRLIFFSVIFCLAILQSGCTGITTENGLRNGLRVDNTGLNFGTVAMESTSTLKETLTNSQDVSITISNLTISGPGFNVSGISPGSIIGPGESAVLKVIFSPVAVGSATGVVTLTTNANNGSLTIPLHAVGVHSATVSWNGSASKVNGYFVYRGTNAGGPYSKLNLAAIPGTVFVDLSVTPGQTYYYVITAVGSDNLESAFSKEASIFVP